MSGQTPLTLTRPIFILGLNKSGTSLLNLCLAQHASVSGIRDFSRPKKWKGGTAHLRLQSFRLGEGQKIPNLLEKLTPKPGGSGRWAHPDVRHLYRLTEAHVEPDDRDHVVRAYREGMCDSSKRLCEKSPPNLIRSRYLQALFPDAVFITIVRDPYANISANGKVRTKWGTVRDQAVHWAAAHRLFLEDRPQLSRSLLLRYEDLVADVKATLGRVCAFSDLDAAELAEPPLQIDPTHNQFLIDQLEPDDVAVIDEKCGEVMGEFGYNSLSKRDHPDRTIR